MSHQVRNTGKHADFLHLLHHLLLLLFENMNLTKHNSNELEILRINRFSSELVHTHIIFPLTPLLLEKLMIIGPDNTL